MKADISQERKERREGKGKRWGGELVPRTWLVCATHMAAPVSIG